MSRLRQLAARARIIKERREAEARAVRPRAPDMTTEQKRAKMRQIHRAAAARVAAGAPPAPRGSPPAERKRQALRALMARQRQEAAAYESARAARALPQTAAESEPEAEGT